MPVKTWLAAAAASALLWTGAAQAQAPDAPNPYTVDARGWAVGTVGGRGGRIIKVSNLNASGPGSYRAAIEAEGPRIVVFEVGGTIDMGGQQLKIANPYLTIAGQTAPSPGITVIKAETVIATHDVVIQHLRFRPGDCFVTRQRSRVGYQHDQTERGGCDEHGPPLLDKVVQSSYHPTATEAILPEQK